jgi:hypothetical protein
MASCPHADIRFCPLYHAMHEGRCAGYSCDDGQLGPMPTGCGVTRGISYAAAIKGLLRVAPEVVERCRAAEADAASRAQRERNMRSAAVH